jgi:1-acyl-sn-glycerol-3-phosphate acyltransferase
MLLRVAGWTLALAPFQITLRLFNLPLAQRLPMIYHRGCCRSLGFKILRYGKQSRHRPTLFVCNHTSYLDIIVLGAIIPGSFVAKAEVRNWPIFGILARLQNTVFVERRAVRTAHHRDEMATRLEKGTNLILFPEGTSNDGNRVLPFKSAFFGVTEKPVKGEPLRVQPVSISYTKLNDIPMGRRYRPYFAWYGDMELAGHLWAAIGLGRPTITVEFHEVLTIEKFKSRKELAKACEEAVSDGVSRAIGGKLGRPTRSGLWPPKRARTRSAPLA